MQAPLREQFIFVTLRFKRACMIRPSPDCLQQSELAVMARASAGRACGKKGVSTADIQQDLPISKPAVSQTLNSLERKGFITRMIDPEDRRKIAVGLTPEGEKALEEARRRYDASMDELLGRFGLENTRALLSLINRLMDILDKI